MRSFKLYQGPSRLTGAPIVAIATSGSQNPKTGPMLQTWILPANTAPHHAVKTGEDSAVCGSCPLRHSVAQETRCYVRPYQAPRSVWARHQRRAYMPWDGQAAPVSGVRLGSYGDPAAVPAIVWRSLVRVHKGLPVTGYTHGWRNAPDLKSLCMASVDSEAEALEARAMGWRTFRVSDHAMEGEILCPASEQAGKLTTCSRCGLCRGDIRAPSIYIPAH